jgi:hypothetical protein
VRNGPREKRNENGGEDVRCLGERGKEGGADDLAGEGGGCVAAVAGAGDAVESAFNFRFGLADSRTTFSPFLCLPLILFSVVGPVHGPFEQARRSKCKPKTLM